MKWTLERTGSHGEQEAGDRVSEGGRRRDLETFFASTQNGEQLLVAENGPRGVGGELQSVGQQKQSLGGQGREKLALRENEEDEE